MVRAAAPFVPRPVLAGARLSAAVAAPSIARHSRARNRRVPALAALALGLALGVAGCATQPRGLVPIAAAGDAGAAGWPEGPPPALWQDDGDAPSLDAALTHSEQYFAALPPQATCTFGALSYSPQEMIQSLELFRSLVRDTADPRALREQIWQKFRVFASIAPSARNLFTGYYEPLILGSPTPTARFAAPLYARPPDLVQVSLGDFGADLPRRKLMGRVQDGRLVPYYSRQEIQGQEALKDSAQPLAYVNEVDLFFLQIQGSGQVQLPDGGVLRVGYDGSNGQPYRSLGAELVRRGLMPREQVSLQSLRQYLAAHPEQVRTLLYTNPSYVFFRPMGGESGAMGSLGVTLTPGRSIAADANQLPPGALAYVQTDVPLPGQPGATRELHRFMLVQDTGGAIQGHGRVDIFWGSGPDAEWMAGYANSPGRLYLLVAKKEYLPPPGLSTASAGQHQGSAASPTTPAATPSLAAGASLPGAPAAGPATNAQGAGVKATIAQDADAQGAGAQATDAQSRDTQTGGAQPPAAPTAAQAAPSPGAAQRVAPLPPAASQAMMRP